MAEGRETHSKKQSFSLQDMLRCADEAEYCKQRDAFVHDRLQKLLRSVRPATIEAKRLGMHEGFIHPDSVIHVTEHAQIPGFCLDDTSIYAQLVDQLRVSAAIPSAVQKVIDEYFGVDHIIPDRTVSERRVQTYGGRKLFDPLGMREIADAHVAMCAEKSAMAQNCITFLGSRAWLMDSYAQITHRDGSIDDGQHLYNVIEISSDRFVLYDPSHPFEITKQGVVVDIAPAQFIISAQDFATLQSGGELRLLHREEQLDASRKTVIKRVYRYGGAGSVRKV